MALSGAPTRGLQEKIATEKRNQARCLSERRRFEPQPGLKASPGQKKRIAEMDAAIKKSEDRCKQYDDELAAIKKQQTAINKKHEAINAACLKP